MIPYHGTPVAVSDDQATRILTGHHAFVSYANMTQLSIVQEVCQSWSLDNGAFSFWQSKKSTDWNNYYEFIESNKSPNMDFFIIPDVINGNEDDNDLLIEEMPKLKPLGLPVFHTAESLDRLERLCNQFHHIALGSSSLQNPGTEHWWNRMHEILEVICDNNGKPKVKIHGLRMLNPEIFTKIPFTSADSTSVGRNTTNQYRFNGGYRPISAWARAQVLIDRIESFNSPQSWRKRPIQMQLIQL